ncbi:MAG: HAMP domain-containing sensor histidine kinase, partial [candidate division NC10 bacterium]
FILQEHPETAWASFEWAGQQARLGQQEPGARTLEREIKAWTRVGGRAERGKGGAQLLDAWTGMRSQAGVSAKVRLAFRRDMLEAEIQRSLELQLRNALAISAAILLLGVLGALYFAEKLTRPLAALTKAALEVGSGRFDVVVPEKGMDETRGLARGFNAMATSIKEFVRLREETLFALTHELNNPLAGLKIYVELLARGGLPEAERIDAVHTMFSALRRMEDTVASTLKMIKADYRKEDRQGKPIRVDLIFNEAVHLFAPLAESKSLRMCPLPESAASELPADEELLKRIATNLISNAVKYTPNGGTVNVGLKDYPEEVAIWVSDTGCGIAAEDIPHIFEKFERAHNGAAVDVKIPSIGLGLNIVRNAVNSLGGRISVVSRLGAGSTFFVTLPKKKRENA